MSLLLRSIFPVTHKRSSAIVGLGHDRQSKTLAVRWRSGNVSFHYRFPREMFAEFLGAESLGKFFWQRVRGKFKKVFHGAGSETSPRGHTPGVFQNPSLDCSPTYYKGAGKLSLAGSRGRTLSMNRGTPNER